MKTKFLIVIPVLIFCALVIVFWYRNVHHVNTFEVQTGTTSLKIPSIETSNTFSKINDMQVGSNNTNAIVTTNLSPAELRSLQIKQAIEGKNVPITFYGRVIDQDSNGLSEVAIVFRVMQPRADIDFALAKNIPGFQRITDANGFFSVEGISGSDLNIESVSKDGYRLSPKTQMGYHYSQSPVSLHPNPQNPVIIKMWKLGEPQQLISHSLTRIGIPVDNQPVQFDLFNGKKVFSGGQLVVRSRRDPQILPPRSSRYDWSLELEIPNGGLVTNSDEFMYRAPQSGYQETFNFNMSKDIENWTTVLDQQFYIQLENGKYFGSLSVHFSTVHDTPPLGLNLNIVINPNGSPNLQR